MYYTCKTENELLLKSEFLLVSMLSLIISTNGISEVAKY